MAIQELNKDPFLVFARDTYGFRPLSININHLGVFGLSENSLPTNNSKTRELNAGEIIFVNNDGIRSYQLPQKIEAACIFEHIYFHFPKGQFSGINIIKARHNLGQQLAIEEREKNMAISESTILYAPDSAHIAAVGYSEETNLPLRPGIIRRQYQSNQRGFMAKPEKRASILEAKYEVIPEYVKDKKIILIDDSIVRGNASKYLVELLREEGATEIHLRIASSKIDHPCIYGIDHKTYEELKAHGRTTEEIRDFIGADSLLYLTVESMHKAIGLPETKSCNACFTGNYPFK